MLFEIWKLKFEICYLEFGNFDFGSSFSDIFDFPIEGICSIKNCNFEEFEKRLLDIHSISKENYFSRLSKDKYYVMEYNEKVSTIEILRKKIDLLLANELPGKNIK